MPRLEWNQESRNAWRSEDGNYLILRNHTLCPEPYWALCSGCGVGGGATLEDAQQAAEEDHQAALEGREYAEEQARMEAERAA